jgi:hypothetical protein
MNETKSQMLEARAQFALMFRSALPFIAFGLALLLGSEVWLTRGPPLLSFGCLVGCAYGLLNMAVLFWFLAPFFFFREKPVYVLMGVVISLGVGALLMFTATLMEQRWMVGLALGVASPAMMGTLYSLQTFATTTTKS